MIIKKIYSRIDEQKLLHIVVKNQKIDFVRKEIVPANNFIQCSLLNLEKGKTFQPHKHIFKKRSYEKQIAQESWIVVSGKVKCIFYDVDDSIIHEAVLVPGEASFTLEGGHNYEILESNTFVYEYKTGPYEGQKNDKVFIEGSN